MDKQHQLVQLLCTLPPDVLHRLYDRPPVVCQVYRCVGALAKAVLARMLFATEPLPAACLKQWMAHKEHVEKCQSEMQLLIKLGIVEVTTDESGGKELRVHAAFKSSLQLGLCSPQSSSGLQQVPASVIGAKHAKAAGELAAYAADRWNCVLQFLALCHEATAAKGVSNQQKLVLQRAQLLAGDSFEMTKDGFQYLLMERYEQLWIYVLSLVRICEDDADAMSGVLELLCAMCLSAPGAAYYIGKHYTTVQNDFIQHMREIGLVHIRRRKDGWFYVTPAMRSLAGATTGADGSPPEAGASTSAGGFLVTETNFRVYAYTSSRLQLSILSTFCHMLYRFENMSVGVLTRESVAEAMKAGITAEQIISYLRTHAHHSMGMDPATQHLAQFDPTLGLVPPAVVADQLRLWQLERARFTYDKAVCYSTFESEDDYTSLVQFVSSPDSATERNGPAALLQRNDLHKVVIVRAAAHDAVKLFWKRQKKAHKQAAAAQPSSSG